MMTMPSLPTMIHPGRHAHPSVPGASCLLDGFTLTPSTDVVQLLQRFDALNHLSAAYFSTTRTLGEHEGAQLLLSSLVNELQRDAVPVIGTFANRDRFLDALEALQ